MLIGELGIRLMLWIGEHDPAAAAADGDDAR